MNGTKNTIVTVTDPLHDNQSVSVETKGVKARIITKVVKGMPQITIKISGGGTIVEEDGRTSQGISMVKKQVEGLLDRKIASNIRASLKKIQQEYKSDVIGLAAIVHSQNDREWETRLKYKWQTIFPQVPFKVSVRIHIHSNALKQIPAKEE
jgi:spore germination protein KC